MKKSRLVKHLVLLGQIVLIVLIVYFLGHSLEKAWNQFTNSEFQVQWSIPWLCASFAAYAACLVFPASYWYCALWHLGQKPTLYRSIRAHIVGHLGKYVPGKVCVVLLRTGCLRGRDVDTTVCVLSIFLEGLMQMAVGAMVVAAVLLWWMLDTGQKYLLPGVIVLFVGILTAITPPVFKRIVRIIGLRKFSSEIQKVDALPWKTFLYGIPLMLVFWGLISLSYWLLIRAMGIAVPVSAYPLCLAAIACSMVAGFIFVAVPAGMGVREMIICMLMFPVFQQTCPETPEAAAAMSVVLLRLSWILVEMVWVACVYWLRGKELSERDGTATGDEVADCEVVTDRGSVTDHDSTVASGATTDHGTEADQPAP